MGAHTKGPWSVRGGYARAVTILAMRHHTDANDVTRSSLGEVAKTAPVGNENIRRANARLIASAPELLEACEAAEFLLAALCVDRDTDTRAKLRAAIRKATGEAS